MSYKIKFWIFNRWKRFLVRNRKFSKRVSQKFDPVKELSYDQKLAVSIVKRAIINYNADLLVAPNSGIRYIRFDNVFIRIEPSIVTIINGVYSYHIQIPEPAERLIIQKFNRRLEQIQTHWESEAVSKTKRSLTTILEELNK